MFVLIRHTKLPVHHVHQHVNLPFVQRVGIHMGRIAAFDYFQEIICGAILSPLSKIKEGEYHPHSCTYY